MTAWDVAYEAFEAMSKAGYSPVVYQDEETGNHVICSGEAYDIMEDKEMGPGFFSEAAIDRICYTSSFINEEGEAPTAQYRKELAVAFRHMRYTARMSGEKAAEAAGMDTKTIYGAESETKDGLVSLATLIKMAAAYGFATKISFIRGPVLSPEPVVTIYDRR